MIDFLSAAIPSLRSVEYVASSIRCVEAALWAYSLSQTPNL